jgi:hypothetical protein
VSKASTWLAIDRRLRRKRFIKPTLFLKGYAARYPSQT